LILGGDLAVLQEPRFDGFAIDPFSLFDDGFGSAKVGVSGCDVFQTLMITLVVIVLDERLDPRFKITGQIIIFKQDAVYLAHTPTHKH